MQGAALPYLGVAAAEGAAVTGTGTAAGAAGTAAAAGGGAAASGVSATSASTSFSPATKYKEKQHFLIPYISYSYRIYSYMEFYTLFFICGYTPLHARCICRVCCGTSPATFYYITEYK